MLRRSLPVALLVVGVAGCAEPDPPELSYLPPSGLPAGGRTAYVRQPPYLVWGNLVDRLQQQEGLEITELDQNSGELVAEYHGDPEPFVDCGWIVVDDGDTAEHLPAAQAAAVIERRRDDVRRRLDLAARMTVEVEPVERDAVVRAETSYVLTKAVLPARDGTATPLHEETISFTTGQSASFPVGTTCQPNGRFEDLVFDALPAMFMAGS